MTLKLQNKFMGKTGLKVSEFCFGAMTVGDSPNWKIPTAEEEISIKLLNRFEEVGGNFIDTADAYGAGASEVFLGNWLKSRKRDDFIIATKVKNAMGPGPNDIGLSRKHIMAAADASLKRLGTDYIDIYQLHGYDNGTPLKETMSALNDLVRSGKARYIGVSNFCGSQLQKAIDMSNYYGLEKFTVFQPQYSLLERRIEWELVGVCHDEGLGIIPWSPLKGGWLSGRYGRDKKLEAGSRVEWAEKVGFPETSYTRFAKESTWKVLDVLAEVAKANNKTQSQVAIRWVAQKPNITAPIIGARTLEQLNDNLGAMGWTLSDADMKKLDEASAVEVPYPFNLFAASREPSRNNPNLN